MLEQRKFLFLLKELEYSYQRILSSDEYGKLRTIGMSEPDFARFAIKNWDLVSIFFIFAGLKAVYPPKPRKIESGGLNDALDLYDIRKRCFDAKQVDMKDGKIRTTFDGRKFVEALPFWNAVAREYGPLSAFLGGTAFSAAVGLAVSFLR